MLSICIGLQLELRDLKAGRKTQERKRPYDMVEVLWLDSVTHQYLYEEGQTRLCLSESVLAYLLMTFQG